MKAQMFIITIVFLVGLVFAVQTNLAAYSFLDVAEVFQNSDGLLLKGIKDAYRNAGSVDCAQSIINLDELTTTLNGAVIQGTAIEVGYVFKSCIELAPPQVTREQLEEVKVTIHLRSLGSDITETATF